MPYREPVTQRIVYYLGESGSGFKPRSLNGYHDIVKIKAECAALGGDWFEDEEFPANETSLGMADAANYIWRRPFDICGGDSEPPEFIVDEADRFDIRQGNLGNCWLLAAVADLTLNKKFLEFTLTKDNSFVKKYCGAFHFRFWQYGKWIDVTIDDRLPCKKKDGRLAFMHSDEKNEFWGALLEKAFAKLNGSYAALDGGFTFQALQDFTGGFTEIFNLKLPELIKIKLVRNESDFFDLLSDAQKRSSFMGSSVKAQTVKREKHLANGLVAGHAYSITDLRRIPIKGGTGQCIELLRLRNPWGNAVEWNGDFSDNSPCWEEYFDSEVKLELGVTYRADGEFWMTVTDYLEQFDRIEICHALPFELTDNAEEARSGDRVIHYRLGQWTKGVTAGGPFSVDSTVNPNYETNPQYLLTVKGKKKDMLAFICLMKNERKAEGQCNAKHFSCDVFDVSKFSLEKLATPLDTDFFDDSDPLEKFHPPGGPREVTLRFRLAPGNYVIVPSTESQLCSGNYLLRIITMGDSTLASFDKSLHYAGDKIEIKDSSPAKMEEMKRYQELFKEVAAEDEQVDWWELKLLLDKSFHSQFQYEGFGFSEESCRSMVALYDGDCSGKLEFYEFMKLWLNLKKWKAIFDSHAEGHNGGSPSVLNPNLGHAFAEAGYSVSKEVLSRIVLRYGDRNGELWLGNFIVAAVRLEAVFEDFLKMDVDGRKTTNITFETWLTNTMYS